MNKKRKPKQSQEAVKVYTLKKKKTIKSVSSKLTHDDEEYEIVLKTTGPKSKSKIIGDFEFTYKYKGEAQTATEAFIYSKEKLQESNIMIQLEIYSQIKKRKVDIKKTLMVIEKAFEYLALQLNK